MSIQVRRADNTLVPLEGAAPFFVEITDAEGKPGLVIWQTKSGAIRMVSADDPEMLRYCSMFKLQPSQVVRPPKL